MMSNEAARRVIDDYNKGGMAAPGVDESFESLSTNATTRLTAIDLSDKLGQRVFICGMVEALRVFREHAFMVVRDRTGSMQVVIPADTVHRPPAVGSYVEVQGVICQHPSHPGAVEVHAANVSVVGTPRSDFPITLNRAPKETLETLLDLRPLSIRNPAVAAGLRIQSAVGHAFRECLDSLGFTEIHTPKIVEGGTEGGSQVFSVNYFDRLVTLAQSPQLYKQIAVGAFERVYEIGAVYRAENSNTSRHLTEFTGLDLELAFIHDEHDVMDVLEQVIKHVYTRVPERAASSLSILGRDLPVITEIPRITCSEAVALVGGQDSSNQNFDKQVGAAVRERYGARAVFIYDYPAKEKPFYIRPREASTGTHSFDLLIDGLEISSGGQRIHDSEQLRANMRRHKLNPDEYEWYLSAFDYGMPPHGGCGLGLERLTECIVGTSNVRNVTLFPRDVRRTSP
jgi:nondiscriminating aspartyl-tRNA synthetase